MKQLRPMTLDMVVESPPARGAWIETIPIIPKHQERGVAPRAGGVD